LPSASISNVVADVRLLAHAPITNTSLTAMQAMVSTPFARSAAAFST